MACGDCITRRRCGAALTWVELGARNGKTSRFGVTTAVNVTITIFWELTQCSIVPTFLTNLVPPSASLKTKCVVRTEVLTVVLTNIHLFWNVTLRIWALPTFRNTPLPLFLSVQKSWTTYRDTRYILQDLTLVAFYQITRRHHRIPKCQWRCRVGTDSDIGVCSGKECSQAITGRLCDTKRCRGVGNNGRGHVLIKVVKKRRGKKQIINERTGKSWRASE